MKPRPFFPRDFKGWVAIALTVAGTVNWGAGVSGYPTAELAVLLLGIAFPLTTVGVVWFGYLKTRDVIGLGRSAKQFLESTEELRSRLTQPQVYDAYNTSADAETEIADTVGKLLEVAKSFFVDSSTIRSTIMGADTIVEMMRRPIRVRRGLGRLLELNKLVRDQTTWMSVRASLQSASSDVTEASRPPNDVRRVLGHLEQFFQQLTGSAVACFKYVDPAADESKHLHCIFSESPDPERVRIEPETLSIDGSIAGHVLISGKALVFGSLDEITGKFMDNTWAERRKYIASGIFYPVTVNNAVVGVLSVDSKAKGAFSSQDVPLVRYCAETVAVLFQMSRLPELIRQERNGEPTFASKQGGITDER